MDIPNNITMPSFTLFERRARIPKLMYVEGFNAKEMAKQLGVHRHTVDADLRALRLKLYSSISDKDLDNDIARELRELSQCTFAYPALAYLCKPR